MALLTKIDAKRKNPLQVGVVSDSHGLLRPAVCQALKGCNVILHAGDVGNGQILQRLAAIAPTYAVRGNVDRTGAVASLPVKRELSLAGLDCLLVHRQADLDACAGWWRRSLIIFGHSHKPAWVRRASGWVLNPGAIGPRRFNLPLGLVLLKVRAANIDEVIRLDLHP